MFATCTTIRVDADLSNPSGRGCPPNASGWRNVPRCALLLRTALALLLLTATRSVQWAHAHDGCVQLALDDARMGSGGGSRASRIQVVARELADLRTLLRVNGDAAAPVCADLAQMSILYDPNADDEAILESLEAQPDEQFGMFAAQGSRWTTTATNGSVAIGNRMTLTYSFVPDGTSIAVAGFGGAAGNVLHAELDANFPGGRTAWKAQFQRTFDRWSELMNVTFVEVSDDGASFPASAGLLGARGDIRIAMRPLGAPLAVNFYPQFGGDMVLDSEDIAQFCNATDNFRTLHNTLMHEQGHGLGLAHVMPQSGTKLMEPVLNSGFDGPQEDDIRAVQSLYGDAHEPNGSYASHGFVGGPLREAAAGRIEYTLRNLAIERGGESDWYGFTAFAMAPIAIHVLPIGSSYESGAQSATVTSTVDARAARNLGLRLWRRVSAATGQLELFAQIDFNSAGVAEYHPPIPYSVAGYMLVEVYAEDGLSDVQRYELRIANGAIDPTPPPQLLVHDLAAGATLANGAAVQMNSNGAGQTVTRTLTIQNGGEATLTLGAPQISGANASEFSASLIGSSVAAGATASLAIAFTPGAGGSRSALLTLPSNDPQRPTATIQLQGVAALQPRLELFVDGAALATGQAIAFGDAPVGGLSSRTLVVRNGGEASLTISGVQVTGAFGTNLASMALAPGASVITTITAQPTTTGTQNGQLRIFSNTPAGPVIHALSATGVLPPPDCDANGVSDADEIAAGASDCNGNGIPDGCEADADGDGLIDGCDPNPFTHEQLDSDGDGTPDVTDSHPLDPTNGAGQTPVNGGGANGIGDDGNEAGVGAKDDGEDARLIRDEDVVFGPAPCGFGVGFGLMASVLGLSGATIRRRR
ncbi:MAG: choice-of-anchor D domain-containing protein [Planctomycetia bacterium]|nr:MAG: choice-of-anchor D domain-containing protein [Planctomycetia bacterium]